MHRGCALLWCLLICTGKATELGQRWVVNMLNPSIQATPQDWGVRVSSHGLNPIHFPFFESSIQPLDSFLWVQLSSSIIFDTSPASFALAKGSARVSIYITKNYRLHQDSEDFFWFNRWISRCSQPKKREVPAPGCRGAIRWRRWWAFGGSRPARCRAKETRPWGSPWVRTIKMNGFFFHGWKNMEKYGWIWIWWSSNFFILKWVDVKIGLWRC